ncbi:hypothetical protein TraAM80_03068 [Trypanosoma rangeli]|uniref:Uncharacterized protein n=1 Tax=Trypanosoma rangeli TaxID=5698 RepID=A0A3R7M2K7_TRYRA|nr:uncharacterized protein TraAM80_03068 [Trypanosoma rangeli]RNF07920.1 hypothetical protein TraAM80_03068 [Trypanosoma rangeli]|eukprot:RNF07920.1 hypothetical protein TraAM80_03068 [Trypanosoma rangeli]
MDDVARGQNDDVTESDSSGRRRHEGDETTTASFCYSTALEGESGSSDLELQPPLPLCSYTCSGGEFLHLFRSLNNSGEGSIHYYSPWTVCGDDDCSLVAHVEVDDEEKEFTLGVCGATERVVGTFLQYFASGQTMHPIGAPGVWRLCICPWHRRALLLASLDDLIISCIHLPSAEYCRLRNERGRRKEELTQRTPPSVCEVTPIGVDAWRVVVEHKGRGFVRLYAIERRRGTCYCDASLSQLS